MFALKTAILVRAISTVSTVSFDNLALSAHALNADMISRKDLNIESLCNYDCIIIVDDTDYRTFNDLAIRIRHRYPKVFMGWHQEKEVDNILRRHKCHGDIKSSEESFCISTLKVWDSIKACNFIIVHNRSDFSISFYKIFGGGIPCFSSGPFLPIDLVTRFFKPRKEKQKRILIGTSYGWREGGLLGYIVAGQDTFKDFELVRRIRTIVRKPEEQSAIMVEGGFSNRPVKSDTVINRIDFAKYISKCYAGVYLREPTACRSNAIAGAVGTPIIGNRRSDVQQTLFPLLLVDKNDLTRVSFLLTRLVNDNEFYDECVKLAQQNLGKVGSEQCGETLRNNILKAHRQWQTKK